MNTGDHVGQTPQGSAISRGQLVGLVGERFKATTPNRSGQEREKEIDLLADKLEAILKAPQDEQPGLLKEILGNPFDGNRDNAKIREEFALELFASEEERATLRRLGDDLYRLNYKKEEMPVELAESFLKFLPDLIKDLRARPEAQGQPDVNEIGGLKAARLHAVSYMGEPKEATLAELALDGLQNHSSEDDPGKQ